MRDFRGQFEHNLYNTLNFSPTPDKLILSLVHGYVFVLMCNFPFDQSYPFCLEYLRSETSWCETKTDVIFYPPFLVSCFLLSLTCLARLVLFRNRYDSCFNFHLNTIQWAPCHRWLPYFKNGEQTKKKTQWTLSLLLYNLKQFIALPEIYHIITNCIVTGQRKTPYKNFPPFEKYLWLYRVNSLKIWYWFFPNL